MGAPKEMQSGKGNTLMPLYGSTHTLLEYTHTHKRAPMSSHSKPGWDTTHTHRKQEMEEATNKEHTITQWRKLEANSLI